MVQKLKKENHIKALQPWDAMGSGFKKKKKSG